jgi:hypothetical protein
MKKSTTEKWAATREKGFARYLVVNGLVYIGIPSAFALWLLADPRSDFPTSESFYLSPEFRIVSGLFIALIFGLFFAAVRWRAGETFFNWGEKRTEGLLKYVLVEGILFKGLPLVLLLSLIAFNPILSIKNVNTYDVTFSSVAKLISMGILLGTMYGFATWYSIEAKTFWSKTRSAGKAAYVLKNGLFLFGWPYAIAMTSFGYILKYKEYSDLEHYLFSMETLVAFGFYAVFFGVIMGFVSWAENEKDYARSDSESILNIS